LEVKSKLVGEKSLVSALTQVAKSATLCESNVWTGLFVHEGNFDFQSNPDANVLNALQKVYDKFGVAVKCVSFGPSIFFRFWENSLANADGIHDGPAWHSYFIDHLAPAYFIGNLVAHVARIPDEHAMMWFPIPGPHGKESKRRWYKPLGGEITQFG
jgi:hypothetical protein